MVSMISSAHLRDQGALSADHLQMRGKGKKEIAKIDQFPGVIIAWVISEVVVEKVRNAKRDLQHQFGGSCLGWQ